MDHITNLKATYHLLCQHIDSFVEYMLDKGELVNAEVYKYPVFTNKDIGLSPQLIELTPVTGEQALLLALDHLKANTIKQEQSGRIVPRLPGAIIYHHPDLMGCLERLEHINLLKNTLAQMIQGISTNKDVRFEVVRDALPLLIKKVALRHIIFANRPVKSISYSWVNRHNGKILSKKHVLDILKTSEDYQNKNSIRDPNFAEYVAQEIVTISAMPASSQFVVRRPLRITPMLNFNYYKDMPLHLTERPSSSSGAKAPKNFVAHSPAFVFNCNPKIYPFQSYDANNHVNDKPVTDTPILPRLHLYLKTG